MLLVLTATHCMLGLQFHRAFSLHVGCQPLTNRASNPLFYQGCLWPRKKKGKQMQLMSWKNNTLVSISIEISYFLFSGKGKKKKKSSPMHTQAFIPWTAPQLAANWVLHPHAPHHHRTRRCYVTESQHLFKDLAEPAMWVVQTWSCSILGATSGWGETSWCAQSVGWPCSVSHWLCASCHTDLTGLWASLLSFFHGLNG